MKNTRIYAFAASLLLITATSNLWAGPPLTNQGNGSKIQLSTGTTTTNNCVKFDANGNTVDAGVGCGTSGSTNLGTSTSAANPLISGDATSGFYTAGAALIDVSISGTKLAEWASGTYTITSANANAFAVGLNGVTNPAFSVDASTASSATGVNVKSAAAFGGVTLSATSSAASEALTLASKGTGAVNLSSSGAGGIVAFKINGATHFTLTNNNSGSVVAWAMSASTFGSTTKYLYTGAADTGLVASTESPNWYLDFGQIRTHSTGALTLQRDFRIKPNTHAFSGASTITDAATFAIDGPPLGGTNATITNASGIYIPTEALTNTTNGYGINVATPSGATSNFAARIAGDILFAGTAPSISSCGSGTIVTGSTDHKGQVSGITTATACTITFSQTLGAAPTCTFTTDAGITPTIGTITTAAVTTAMTSLTGTLYYQCF